MGTTAATQPAAADPQAMVETARRFVAGGACQVAAMLTLRSALRPTHPALARQLSRRLAEQLIQGQSMTVTEVDALWQACRTDEAFSHARRVLRRRRDGAPQIGPARPGDPPAVDAQTPRVRHQPL